MRYFVRFVSRKHAPVVEAIERDPTMEPPLGTFAAVAVVVEAREPLEAAQAALATGAGRDLMLTLITSVTEVRDMAKELTERGTVLAPGRYAVVFLERSDAALLEREILGRGPPRVSTLRSLTVVVEAASPEDARRVAEASQGWPERESGQVAVAAWPVRAYNEMIRASRAYAHAAELVAA